MKILLWAPYGAGEHYWGPGISAYRLYKSGLPDGVKVYLAHGFKEQKEFTDVFEEQYFIPELNRSNRLSELKFLWNAKKWINKNSCKFDVVHVLGLYEISFRPAIWFEKNNIPVFCKITSIGEGLTQQSLLSKLLGLAIYRKKNISEISGFIAISEEIKKSLINYGIENHKIHKLPNGVNIDIFKPVEDFKKKELRDELNLRDVFTVIFVGGISERKQPHKIAKAVKKLVKNNGFDIQLVILGPDRDQIELKKIKSLVSNENLSNNIIYRENSNQPEKYYQASDIFCLPSKREGMSNALLEAMACGLPSIVTKVSGSNELINDGINGYFINEYSDIYDKLLHYCNNKSVISTHSRNSIKTILSGYRTSDVLYQHLNCFETHGVV